MEHTWGKRPQGGTELAQNNSNHQAVSVCPWLSPGGREGVQCKGGEAFSWRKSCCLVKNRRGHGEQVGSGDLIPRLRWQGGGGSVKVRRNWSFSWAGGWGLWPGPSCVEASRALRPDFKWLCHSNGSHSVESDSLQPMDCNPLGSSVHGVLQARTLEWVAILFSRGSSQPREQTRVSCTASRFFTTEPPGKVGLGEFQK